MGTSEKREIFFCAVKGWNELKEDVVRACQILVIKGCYVNYDFFMILM